MQKKKNAVQASVVPVQVILFQVYNNIDSVVSKKLLHGIGLGGRENKCWKMREFFI